MSEELPIRTSRAPFPTTPKERSEEVLPIPQAVPQRQGQLLLEFDGTKALAADPAPALPLGEVLLPEPVIPNPPPVATPSAEVLPLEQLTQEPTPDAAPEPQVSTGFSDSDPLQARMLNEFVYCRRLFYYEFVEGVFMENADTARGLAIHDKVDRGLGDLPAPDATPTKKRKKKRAVAPEEAPNSAAGDDGPGKPEQEQAQEAVDQAASGSETVLHSRSASLGSERLGVVAKMDLIEVRLGAEKSENDAEAPVDDADSRSARRATVTPVDYKAGSPRRGAEANELWDPDKMQLGLQILILRDNGYVCDEGVIFYRGTNQRVRMEMTPDLEAWIVREIAEARLLAVSPEIPPPLVNSPKCVRCSLAPVCLPDETRFLAATTEIESAEVKTKSNELPPRRLMAARDDERALYLNTPGLRVGVKSELLVVKDGECVVDEVRLNDVSHVALFGNIQLSTQAVQELCEQEIPIAYFSMGGWFYGLTRGHGLKNVFTRMRQFEAAADPVRCLTLARRMVRAKIRNHRTMLMRLHVEPPAAAVRGLLDAASRTVNAQSLGELLGMEGAAAALYFQHFSGMIKVDADDALDELPGLETPDAEDKAAARAKADAAEFKFDFTQRRRRPPTDPVNALLSLAYSLLAKDCTIATLAVGFDPYVGFYHQPRHGRPALALDLMEEFRPLIAESTVLTAINNRMIQPGHFVRAGDAVNLTKHGRKAFFNAYEQRMNAVITHPVFDYRVSYRRVLELQARLLARYLTGEIPEYVPMVTR